mmetsp:Transcript_19313/g.28580  ORF Transcript_19313/g.28580 Transcript_19313/m.28580 type:complete len:358 (-) Transcript_19313:394-1467(-)
MSQGTEGGLRRCGSDQNIKNIAVSGALVGELVMDDSPVNFQRHVAGVNRHSYSDQSKEMLHDFESGDEPSLMQRGLSWWKKRKESQERRHLQRLAYEQRRKLYEAEHGEAHTLSGNPTFLTITGEKNTESEEEKTDEMFKCIRPSKSGIGVSVEIQQEEEESDFWIPEALVEEEEIRSHSFCPFLLQQAQRQAIAMGLPAAIAHCRWKRLYSLARDGDSFDAFLRLVEGHHRTLLVIRTTKSEIFGGYADSEWKAKHQGNPEFYGSAQAFLFRVVGEEANIYGWTGANRYIQFIDFKNSVLALGGGGDVGAFGLCVANDFQKGSSGNCATFENDPLCSEGNFDIVDVECYGFVTGKF